MKKKLLVFALIFLLLVIAFSGCLEENKSKQSENQIEELITASILILLLTVEDLPEGYSVNYSGTEYISEFSSFPPDEPIESFTIWFSKGSISNPDDFGFISCELNKFNSIEEAEIAFNTTIEYMIVVGSFEVIDGSINVIGTESKAITSPGYDHVVCFRISNIIVVMSSTDYSFTIDLAEIVEQRIYDSFE
ncbi:MAG: hypothetical protein KAS76_01150 [Thermoplasmatales archaeon]|nr:hypothetical protein [Thermoplasmatales archaeon]